jgi:hypothetical protein
LIVGGGGLAVLSIFSTRELATGIWLVIFMALVFISPSTRKSAIDVLKTACSRKLIIPFAAILVYAILFTLLLMQISVWEGVYLKEISLWVLFVGVPVCYGAVSPKTESHYFRKILTDNLRFSVIMELIISSFTFHLLIELTILPVILFLVILEQLSGKEKEYQQVRKFISLLLSVIGFIFLWLTVKAGVK